jgi:hypothetical protein
VEVQADEAPAAVVVVAAEASDSSSRRLQDDLREDLRWPKEP